MREKLDCAILEFGDTRARHVDIEGSYARGRLYLHKMEHAYDDTENVYVLAQMATHLQRFDACLLAVDQHNLAWVRQAMLWARPQLRTPIIGLVRELQAPALDDLYNLGMADFVRAPLCIEEIRIRTERLLVQPRIASTMQYGNQDVIHADIVRDDGKCYPTVYGDPAADIHYGSPDVGEELAADSNLDAIRYEGERALEAFARASASQCATSSEAFSSAKGRMIQSFERSYIHASLAKSSGNITQAARSAKKHRRAFWALMRKHNIDATPYRKVMPPKR